MHEARSLDSSLPTRTLSEQVVADLLRFIGLEKNRSKKISLLSKKTGINSKTIFRLLNFENKPSYLTVFKIYKAILNLSSDQEVLEKSPEVIRTYLRKANPQKLSTQANNKQQINELIEQNVVALEILVLCSCAKFNQTEIVSRYGQFGTESLNQLIKLGAIQEIRPQVFAAGVYGPELTSELIIQMGLQITKSFSKPKNGDVIFKHHHGFFAEGLSKEAFKEWIKIDDEAFQKKLKLSQDPKNQGPILAYTFNSTDTLTSKADTDEQ